jgi:hypothetical protein
MAEVQGLTVGIGGDITDLQKAFDGALKAANRTGQAIDRSMSGASSRLGASFNSLGARMRASFAGMQAPVGQMGQQFNNIGAAWQRMALGAGIGFAAGASAIRHFVGAASDAEETSNLIDVAFGKQSKTVRDWADTFAASSNRSSHAMLQAAGSVQGMISPMLGVNDTTAAMSRNLAGLATDLGSFYNASDTDALQALKGALAGNAEGMRRFGVTLTAGALEEYALSKQVGNTYAAMSEAEKVQLRYMYIMEKSTMAQGDAARTSGSYSNTVKGLQGAFQDLSVQLGQAMLPALTTLAGALRGAVAWVQQLSPETQKLAGYALLGGTAVMGLITAVSLMGGVFAGVGSAVSAAVAVLGLIASTITGVAIPAFAALGGAASTAVMALGSGLVSALLPVLPVIAAVTAALAAVGLIVVGVKAAWDNNIFGMQTSVKNLAKTILDALGAAFDWLKSSWARVSSFVGEKFIYTMAMVRGQSPDEAFAQVAEFNKNGMGLLDLTDATANAKSLIEATGQYLESAGEAVGDSVKGAFGWAKDALSDAWGDAKATFDDFTGELKDALQTPAVQAPSGATNAANTDFKFAPAAGGKAPPGAHDAGRIAGDEGASAINAASENAGRDLGDVATGVAGSLGDAGNILSAGLQGGSMAGPMGAAIAAGGAMLMQSQSVAAMIGVLNNVLGNLANSINPLIEGLMPFIQMIAFLAGEVGKVIGVISEALSPVFAMLADVLMPIVEVVGGVLRILQPFLAMLGVLLKVSTALNIPMKLLAVAAGVLADAVNWVAKGISWVANGIIEAIATIIETLGSWLPVVGDDISAFADSLRDSKIDMTQFDKSTEDAAAEMMQTPKDINSAYGPYLDTVQSVNEALTNVPQGFKTTLARFNAAIGETDARIGAAATRAVSGGTGASGTGTTNNNVDLSIKALDGASLFTTIKRQMELDSLRKLGTTAVASGAAARV